MKLKLLIVFLTFWMAPSIIIDFIAAPSIFRSVSSLQEAGTLGMLIFKAFNSLELILSLLILTLGLFLVRQKTLKKGYLLYFSILVLFAGTFLFHISPTIMDINQERWELPEDSERYKVLTSEHQFYHQLYVKLEGTKVLLLLGGLVMVMRIREEKA